MQQSHCLTEKLSSNQIENTNTYQSKMAADVLQVKTVMFPLYKVNLQTVLLPLERDEKMTGINSSSSINDQI